LIKNLRQLKGYTATRFLRKFRTKKGEKSTNSDDSLKRTVTRTYNAAK